MLVVSGENSEDEEEGGRVRGRRGECIERGNARMILGEHSGFGRLGGCLPVLPDAPFTFTAHIRAARAAHAPAKKLHTHTITGVRA